MVLLKAQELPDRVAEVYTQADLVNVVRVESSSSRRERIIIPLVYHNTERSGARLSGQHHSLSLGFGTPTSRIRSASTILGSKQEVIGSLAVVQARDRLANLRNNWCVSCQNCRDLVVTRCTKGSRPAKHAYALQGLSLGILHDGLDHLVAHAHGVLQTWCKVALDVFEAVAVGIEGTEGYTVRPCLQR